VDLAPERGGPLSDLFPLDLTSLQQSADAFCEQLARLIAPQQDDSLLALGPWLVVAGTIACELALLPDVLRRAGPSPSQALPGVPLWQDEDEA
jgi:hypothetical protein